MKLRILVTSAGGGLAPEFLRLFKNIKGYNIITFGVDKTLKATSKNFADFFYKVSGGKSKKFITEINKISKNNKINLIIPGSDEDALNLSKNKKLIENKITKIACVKYETLKILSDKEKTYNYLKKNNIEIPEFKIAKTKNALLKNINYFIKKYKEVVIKPARSRGGRNVFIIRKSFNKEISRNNGREIELGFRIFLKNFNKYKINFYPIIVMEKLKTPTFDFDMLCFNGKLISGISRKRINPSVPNDGHIIQHDEKLYKIGKKIAKLFNLHWLYDCDFMLDKFNNPKIIEINPRMSGSASVSICAGIPLLENLIKIYLNKKLNSKRLKGKVKVIPSISLFKQKI